MSEPRAEVRNPVLLAAVVAVTTLLAGVSLTSMMRLEGDLRTARLVGKDLSAAFEQTLPATDQTEFAQHKIEFWLLTAAECAECRTAEAAVIGAAQRHGRQAHVVLLDDVSAPTAAKHASAAQVQNVGAALSGAPLSAPALVWRDAQGWRVGDARDPRTLQRALRLDQGA